ncbi:MAG TPA: DUF3467 domain-containing protein [Syntrophales bacterium]|nr:DUF3467 domain-containing protein [Syntrophales bacterium]
MGSFYANAFRVEHREGEIALLFGERLPGPAGTAGEAARMIRRIVLSPASVKRLQILLDAAVRDYGSRYGMLGEAPQAEPVRQGGATAPGPESSPAVRGEKALRLVRLVRDLDVPYGFERSFKGMPATLLGKRFLIGFKKDMLREDPPERLAILCRAIGMPADDLAEFCRLLPEANIVLFGYEEGATSSVYKAYLEFGKKFETVVRENPDGPASFLLHLGFKWDTADSTRHTRARYICYPSFSVQAILERVADVFYARRQACPFDIVKGIVDLALRRMRDDEFLYLEVTEEGNPRRSFDINMYRANLALRDLSPWLEMMRRHYGIAAEAFSALYDPAEPQIFGHLSGGIDRLGRDFLTVYFGVKGSSRRGDPYAA